MIAAITRHVDSRRVGDVERHFFICTPRRLLSRVRARDCGAGVSHLHGREHRGNIANRRRQGLSYLPLLRRVPPEQMLDSQERP